MYFKDIRYYLRAYQKFFTTCCILHNICMIPKQRFLHEWLQQTELDLLQDRNISRCVEDVNEAEFIRSSIRDYLADHRLLYLNIIINKRNIAEGKYIFKTHKGK